MNIFIAIKQASIPGPINEDRNVCDICVWGWSKEEREVGIKFVFPRDYEEKEIYFY